MKIQIASLAMSVLAIGLTAAASNTAEAAAVEWAPFIKAKGVTDQELIDAADKVNSEFLVKQKGFISRELIKKSDAAYADLIHWSTQNDATAAADKVNDCASCSEYFKLMNFEASAKAGAGFSHYQVLKKW